METVLNQTTAVQTNASAAKVAPRKRVHVQATPRSMIPPNASAVQSNGSPAPGQSAPTLDYLEIVATCARRKSAIGETLVGRQGKQHLVAACCAVVKSRLGIKKFLDDEKTPTQLDQPIYDAILDAAKTFWQSQANRLLNYGEIKSASFDKPSAEAQKNESGQVVSFKPILNARIHAQKECRDAQESALMLDFCVAQQKKRVDYMQGIITPGGNQSQKGAGKFERDEIDAAKAKLVLLEKSRDEFKAQVARTSGQPQS